MVGEIQGAGRYEECISAIERERESGGEGGRGTEREAGRERLRGEARASC